MSRSSGIGSSSWLSRLKRAIWRGGYRPREPGGVKEFSGRRRARLEPVEQAVETRGELVARGQRVRKRPARLGQRRVLLLVQARDGRSHGASRLDAEGGEAERVAPQRAPGARRFRAREAGVEQDRDSGLGQPQRALG